MYTIPSKKMLPLIILEILQNYTDENHRLSQKNISYILERDYAVTADRKSIKRNLMVLLEMGYEIEYTESIRVITNKNTKEKEESLVLTEFYIHRAFTDSELRLLIDSLVFAEFLPYNQCNELINKLKGLSSKHFHQRTSYACNLPKNRNTNQQLFYNIDIIDEAIAKQRKIQFNYNGPDDNSVMTVNPYQMLIKNGNYLLLCNPDFVEHTITLRLDYITDIQLLNHPLRPYSSLKESCGQSLILYNC